MEFQYIKYHLCELRVNDVIENKADKITGLDPINP